MKKVALKVSKISQENGIVNKKIPVEKAHFLKKMYLDWINV